MHPFCFLILVYINVRLNIFLFTGSHLLLFKPYLKVWFSRKASGLECCETPPFIFPLNESWQHYFRTWRDSSTVSPGTWQLIINRKCWFYCHQSKEMKVTSDITISPCTSLLILGCRLQWDWATVASLTAPDLHSFRKQVFLIDSLNCCFHCRGIRGAVVAGSHFSVTKMFWPSFQQPCRTTENGLSENKSFFFFNL